MAGHGVSRQKGATATRNQSKVRANHGVTRALEQGVELVWHAFEDMVGGEIYVKKIPSMNIVDIAKATSPNARHEVVGIRPGEKLHEEMITSSDSPNTIELSNYFAILGSGFTSNKSSYLEVLKARPVQPGFAYESGSNHEFLSVNQIRNLIKTHIDPEFQPI